MEIQRDDKKVTNIKRTRFLKKYNTETKESLDQLIEELNKRCLPRRSDYPDTRKKTQYYQNKLFRTDSKKFYNRLRQQNPNVKNAPGKEEVEKF